MSWRPDGSGRLPEKQFHNQPTSRVVESDMNKNLLENRVAKPRVTPIVPPVKWNWKWFRVAGLLAVVRESLDKWVKGQGSRVEGLNSTTAARAEVDPRLLTLDAK